MKMPLLLLSSLIVASGCAGSGSSSYGGSGGTTTSASYLVDGSGRTLYQFSGDAANSGVSNCTSGNGCISAWPVVAGGTSLAATSGASPQAGLISSFNRSNPSGSQATYAGKPLYYFVSDTSPGVVSGNGVNGFSIVSP
jgi:predicted lipoprotein with Yx(FWY)xxD motif